MEPGATTQVPEALFVIDDRQRVIEWSNAAAVTLGVTANAVLGKPCYEVVGGRDPFGRAVCRANCPAFEALQNGHLGSQCTLVVHRRGQHSQRFVGNLTALPKPPGGALVTLVENPHRTSSTAQASLGTSAVATARALAALTTLSTSMSPDRLEQSMEQALDWLHQATGAEAAELFLVEPRGGDMLLTAYRGLFRNAFSQITRFHSGEGFPGLIQRHGEPIVTQSLAADPRYLRTHVTEKGFRSYVCVPILGPGGVIGVLNVAARRPDLDLPHALRLLTWASRPIGTVLQAGLLQGRESIGLGPVEALPDAEQDFDGLLRAVLRQMMLIGNALGGALTVYDWSTGGLVRLVNEGEFASVVCPDAKAQDIWMCPALVSGHGMALYGPRNRWPLACRQVPATGGVVYCLPLVAAGERVGMVQLGYAGRVPSPPTKYLVALLNAAEQAAPTVRRAWKNLQNQERALRLQSTWRQEVVGGLAHARGSVERPPQEADISDTGLVPPSLEIRCFGAFELYRQGKLVTPDMFKRRGAMTLLKILLIHDGHPVTRDALAELLWPEADPEASANRLHGLVHALRQVVEPSSQDQGWVFIRRDGENYYFDPAAPYQLDVREFREYVSLGERLERRGVVTAAIDAYEAAVNLYRGDLLEDDPYAEWCWEERESLREVYLDALRRLAGLYMEQGVPEKSVESYQRALRIDALREENHQGLMRSLWAAGRRAEALRQYQVCQEILRRELDVDPLSETEQLYFLIRSSGEG